MAEPIARVRKDGTTAWYSRVKLASGKWTSDRMRAATNLRSARKINDELQEAEDRKLKGLAPGGLLFLGTFGELCHYTWEKHFSLLAGATAEASRLHIHGGATADREGPGPSELGPLALALVTSARLEEYFADLAKRPTPRGALGMSPGAINRVRATFSSMFTVAAVFGKWPKGDNPAHETRERTVPKHEIRTLTVTQILHVLEAAGDYWDGPFAVCLLAALRRGEMLALLKRDVDLDRRQITVRRSGKRKTTKGNTHEVVPIHDELVPYLERWMESPGPFMFPGHDGKQRSDAQRFDLRLQAALVRAGYIDHYEHRCRASGTKQQRGSACSLRRPALDEDGRAVPARARGYVERHDDDAPRRCPACNTKMIVTPKAIKINYHATRHSCATAMLESGASLHGVQRIMRHASVKLTTETYSHVSAGFLHDEMAQLDLRKAPRRGEPLRRAASAAEPRDTATPRRMGAGAAGPGLVAPVRRGAGGGHGGADTAIEPSMKRAVGFVEPTGIEPVTYALRMRGLDDGDSPHASQALATPSEFSHAGSGPVLHGSAANGPVGSALVAPVRRGASLATQTREPDRSMREPPSERLGTARNGSPPLPLLTVSEVAARLQVSKNWVHKRLERGELTPIRLGGTTVRISEADLAALIERLQR